MLDFLKEQFLSQNLEDVDFISLSKSQGEKSLNFSEEIPVMCPLIKKRKKKHQEKHRLLLHQNR